MLILCVAYLTLWERKLIGWMQVRRGPNRVRIFGFLPGMGQPFADVIKLLIKEFVVPSGANKVLFVLAPAITLIPAFAIWAVIPLFPGFAIANVDAGLLYVLSLTSVGVYGVILAGWASNSKYAFLGAMRSAAQIVAYEIAMGFALVGVLMVSNSLNLGAPSSRSSRAALRLELDLAVPAVHRVLHLRRGRDQPRAVRRGGRRVRDRGRLPRRIFRHRVRGVLPRRVREHDPDGGADRGVLHRRLADAAATATSRRTARCSRFPCSASLLGTTACSGCSPRRSSSCSCSCGCARRFPRYRYDQIMRLGWKALIPVTIVWIFVEMLSWRD